MHRFLYLVFFILAVNTGYAAIKPAVKKEEKAILKMDSSVVAIRQFDKAALKSYSKQPEFQYKEELTQDLSWWTRFWRWFWNWLGHLF